jgi:hypothetical protein
MGSVPRYPSRPQAGYGPWLVAVAALLLALAALVVLLARGTGETRYVDAGRVSATLPSGTDCIRGVAVAGEGMTADGAGRPDLHTASVGGTLDELAGRVEVIETAALARARCRVELLSSTPDCPASMTAARVVTAVAGPTRQGYGETGAGAILAAAGSETSTSAVGALRSRLRFVDAATPRPRITIAGRTDLLSRACTSGAAGAQLAGFVDPGDQASAAPASAPTRDLLLIGGLVLALAAVAATMGRRRGR